MTESKTRYKKSFTPAQKEQFKQKKEAEKQQIQELYENFLTKKTIQDIVGMIATYKQLHSYSIRNRLLVLAQAEDREDKKFVGVLNSFHNWKKQDIQILKGSKAYKVNVPIFSKRQEESSAEDKVLSYFKLGNVFDISSTSEYEKYLKEQEEIDEKIMKNHEINYELALTHLKTNYPEIRITEDFKHQDKKGSYDPHSKHITLYEHSSHTIFHELGHYLTIEVLKIAGDIHKDYAKNEVLAEIFSYLLMRSFDENVNYNFAYSNCWASRITDAFEIEEFEHAFKAITNYLTKFQEKGEANA